MQYVEKHYGQGKGSGENIMNPKTMIEVEEGGFVELEMVQIRGVDYSDRITEIRLKRDARLVIMERLLIDLEQNVDSKITVVLEGENSTAQVISCSVAQNNSRQRFNFNLVM